VRSASINVPMVTLSGGNQQKAILARWVSRSPQVCLLDEPTKGIDVGAKAEVHGLVADLVRSGVGVVLVSSDVEELFALSHRILVLKDGAVVDELRRNDFDATRIVRSASTGRAEVA
jgi:ABC-type sugar transport system ATPase subunit